ncbi:hypothetical protein ABMA32_04525 [Mesorhizobium sp. VNQ89]|uniref:hypothetical protein n=1 Tax=Mesorhizobium quangtriensis TaxID=3157709 RepID=UPI0032B77863
MPDEDHAGEYRTAFGPLLFETALRAAATAHGLPATCRRRACRESGICALSYQPWNGQIDRGCTPDFAVARAAAEHVEFLRLLGWIDPEGGVYDDLVAPDMETFPKLGPRPVPQPEVWARMIATAFAIPMPPRVRKRPKAEPATAGRRSFGAPAEASEQRRALGRERKCTSL